MEYRGFSEENGKLSITFDEDNRKGDVVEELVWGLDEIEIMVIGEAHTNEYGTCPAMFYSPETDMVYVVDLNDERFINGETVTIEGRTPDKWDREIIDREVA